MRLRTKRRKPLLSIEDLGATADLPAAGIWDPGSWSRKPDEQLLNQELHDKLQAAIEELPEKYRLVLLLRDVEGLDNQQTAESLGLTVATVKARLHRARLAVRSALDRYFAGK